MRDRAPRDCELWRDGLLRTVRGVEQSALRLARLDTRALCDEPSNSELAREEAFLDAKIRWCEAFRDRLRFLPLGKLRLQYSTALERNPKQTLGIVRREILEIESTERIGAAAVALIETAGGAQ